jgi:very-short-patch-repair endonuclease
MEAVEALERLGGVACRSDLLRLTSSRKLGRAVHAKTVVRIRRAQYRLPDADRALSRAAQLGGLCSHLSAAQLHGWEVPFPSGTPWITVPRNSKARRSPRYHLFWADVSEEGKRCTSPLRTVIDCARRLHFAVALAVADSAIRHGDVDPVALARAAEAVRGKGAEQARRVARHGSGRAANPFESVLRALALEAGLDAQPQVPIDVGGVTLHPDVVDRERRIVLEADSWEFHTGKEAHERDCWRYTALVCDGWLVLRFTWRQVMLQPEFVTECLRRLSSGRLSGQTRHEWAE